MHGDEQTIKITDPKVALARAEKYCVYQDRAQQEVRDRLYQWGLWPDAVEQIIADLVTNGFLNEELFALAYARGKFNQNSWGRNKIKQGLKFKRVPDGLIKKALKRIDGDDYFARLTRLLEKKAATLTEKDAFKRRYKLQQYALARGYEVDLILDVLNASEL